jgi:hypothetical protein
MNEFKEYSCRCGHQFNESEARFRYGDTFACPKCWPDIPSFAKPVNDERAKRNHNKI